jgi:hypothetical protein
MRMNAEFVPLVYQFLHFAHSWQVSLVVVLAVEFLLFGVVHNFHQIWLFKLFSSFLLKLRRLFTKLDFWTVSYGVGTHVDKGGISSSSLWVLEEYRDCNNEEIILANRNYVLDLWKTVNFRLSVRETLIFVQPNTPKAFIFSDIKFISCLFYVIIRMKV